MGVRDVGEGEGTSALRALARKILVDCRVRNRDELESMRRHQALGRDGSHRGPGDLEECPAVAIAQRFEHAIAVFVKFRFDTLVTGCHRIVLPRSFATISLHPTARDSL